MMHNRGAREVRLSVWSTRDRRVYQPWGGSRTRLLVDAVVARLQDDIDDLDKSTRIDRTKQYHWEQMEKQGKVPDDIKSLIDNAPSGYSANIMCLLM